MPRLSGGIFDVIVDGEVIFSKHEMDRFPRESEVIEKLRELARICSDWPLEWVTVETHDPTTFPDVDETGATYRENALLKAIERRFPVTKSWDGGTKLRVLEGGKRVLTPMAIVIIALIPLSLRGVRYTPSSASKLLSRNLLVYGLGGIVAPFVGIKLIDLLIQLFPGMS